LYHAVVNAGSKGFRIVQGNATVTPMSDPIDYLSYELDKTESSLSTSVVEKELFKSVA
jgi:hypothetical protein